MQTSLLSLASLALALAALAAAAPAAGAQIILTRETPPPFGVGVGGPGPTILMGTWGADSLRDPTGPDTDGFHDAPGGPDGVVDILDARDFDDLDDLYGGPEDTFLADSGDQVHVLGGGDVVLWSGTFEAYLRFQAIVRWVRDLLQRLFAAQGGEGGTPAFWLAAVQQVSAELEAVDAGPDPSATVLFDDLFDIGPYAFGDLPESPGGCLSWLPFPAEVDPVAACSALAMTAAELAAAKEGAQALLQHLAALAGP